MEQNICLVECFRKNQKRVPYSIWTKKKPVYHSQDWSNSLRHSSLSTRKRFSCFNCFWYRGYTTNILLSRLVFVYTVRWRSAGGKTAILTRAYVSLLAPPPCYLPLIPLIPAGQGRRELTSDAKRALAAPP